MVVIIVQFCEDTKMYWIVHFKCVICRVCELIFQWSVLKNSSGPIVELKTASTCLTESWCLDLSWINTPRAHFISSFFPSLYYHLQSTFVFSSGYAEFYPIVFPNKSFKRFMNDMYDYRESSNSLKLLATSKQISQINF